MIAAVAVETVVSRKTDINKQIFRFGLSVILFLPENMLFEKYYTKMNHKKQEIIGRLGNFFGIAAVFPKRHYCCRNEASELMIDR